MNRIKSFSGICYFLAVVALLLLPATGYSAVRYAVPVAVGTGDCLSWDNACTLQSALTGAVSGDELWVTAGTHKPTTGTDRLATFQLKAGVAIYGGFAEYDSDMSERRWKTNVTILSGDIGVVGNNADNSYHVVTGATGAILDGVTISGGNANGTNPHYNGGGMYNLNASPTLTNVIFNGNMAALGGGMHNIGSNPTLTNVTFSGNIATGEGGGMYNITGSPTLANVTFSNNTAHYGGGMSIHGTSNPTLTNVTFSGNTSTSDGGGMFYVGLSSMTLTNVIFSGNTAALDGGGMYNNANGTTLTNVTFSGNSAIRNGGGMNIKNSILTLTNVTFSGNTAAAGGGVYNVNNGATLKIRNSILWGNSGGEIINSSITANVSYSDIQGGYVGPGNINADPLFVNSAAGDLHLRANSPVINKGSNSVATPALPATDLDGSPRIVYTTVDMGAYEYVNVRYVKSDATTGANNGASWADAYTDLQSALAAAVSGDVIWVAAGTYKPTTGTDRTISFQLKTGVAIYGGFAGAETARADRNWTTNITTLSGDIGAVGDSADNSYHVVSAGDTTDSSALLDGFTITAGNANLEEGGYGGGIYIDAYGNSTLTNLIFSGNSAGSGGGMYIQSRYSWDEPITLTNVTFSNNVAIGSGAGLLVDNALVTLTNATFNNNMVVGGDFVTFGGGIRSSDCDMKLTNVTFSGNSAPNAGGGIFSEYDRLELTNVTFSNNSVTDTTNGAGGGMYTGVDIIKLTNVSFSGNSAAGSAADSGGGGMYNALSEITVNNSIFWGNSAPNAPGTEQFFVSTDSTNPVTINDSILPNGCPDRASCTNILTTNPNLGALGSYGGFTQTIPLLPGSPAINAGNATNCPATDQRGLARVGACDIGAFESQGFILAKTGGDNQSAVSGMTFTNPLDLTVTANNAVEPVNGGTVTFTAPATGASTNPATNSSVIAGGAVSKSVTANATAGGPYSVIASATGAANQTFSLTNSNSVTYSVTYNANGATSGTPPTDSNDYLSDATVTVLGNTGDPILTKTGYIFSGWNTASNGSGTTYSAASTFSINSSTTLYAKWVNVVAYVKPTATGTGDCSSWTNACTTLQTALTNSVAGQEIWVAKGTYKPTTSADLTISFNLKTGVSLYGGFAGTETARDQRDSAANVTTLSGDLNENDNSNIANNEPTRSDNSYHVIYASNVTGSTLDGFTISGGNANGSNNPVDPKGDGGGMYIAGGTPTVSNCTFSNNSAIDAGGGVLAASGNLLLDRVTFANNKSFIGGGMNSDATTTLTNCTFINNTANNNSGGGMANWATTTLINCTFSGNSAGMYGGGMLNGFSGVANLANCTFSGNSAPTGGSGMTNWGHATLASSIFWGNGASEILNQNGIIAASNNIVKGGGSYGINSDPKLGTLGNYGGTTQTIPLLAGSSAIDATNSDCPATDQRGVLRPQGSKCDIGAYEVATPTVTTNAASGITQTGATLNGTVNANGLSTTTTFEYGLTDTYGTSMDATQSPVTGTSATSVSNAITGLTCGTIYHYRATGANIDGTTYGSDTTFSTTPCIPVAPTTPVATHISTTRIDLTWTDNSNNESGFKIYRNGTLINTTAADATSYSDTGLTTGTAYNYTIKATNAGGDSTGVTASATTLKLPAFTSATFKNFTFNTPGSFTVTATGIPAPTFSKTGTLPAGITLNSNGTLSGTPTQVGTFPLTITATNSAGATNQNFSLTVSKGAATVTITPETLSAVYNGSPKTVTATTSPTGLTVTFTYNGSGTAPTNPGIYAVIATINDSNYTGSTTGTLQIIDTTGPNLTVSTLANGSVTNNPTLNITGTASDTQSGIALVTLSGTPLDLRNETGNYTFSTAITLTEGANNITVTATNNSSVSTTDSRTVYLDLTAPTIAVDQPTDASLTGKTYSDISGTIDDPTATVTAIVNSGSPAIANITGTTFGVTVNLIPGLNTIDITAADQNGNSSSVKRTIFSDSTAPNLSVTTPSQDITTIETGITINGTVTDTLTAVTISIKVDDQTFEPTLAENGNFSQPITLSTDKTYNIIVTATDQAGNKAAVQRNIIKKTLPSGDINGDGVVDIADALKALRIAVGLETATESDYVNGDVAPLVNGKPAPDGVIDIADATVILMKTVGLRNW
jgi:uncharacterized repeat protein (TIGR02543 family)